MLILILLALLQADAGAGAIPRQVANPRDLMVEAIDAPDGRASGILNGEMADAIGQGFGTTAPLRIEVTTLKRYRQEGCRRLNVAFTQEGVRLPGEAVANARRIDFGIDYCRNGRPPSSRTEASP
jgi:hypothetical protein